MGLQAEGGGHRLASTLIVGNHSLGCVFFRLGCGGGKQTRLNEAFVPRILVHMLG